jgi:hypothetical protein
MPVVSVEHVLHTGWVIDQEWVVMVIQHCLGVVKRPRLVEVGCGALDVVASLSVAQLKSAVFHKCYPGSSPGCGRRVSHDQAAVVVGVRVIPADALCLYRTSVFIVADTLLSGFADLWQLSVSNKGIHTCSC